MTARIAPCFLAAVVSCTISLTALAQPNDPSGIDFVRIGAPGNQPWQGNGTPQDMAIGRGQVNYEYRIGKFEVTTAQWVDFFNAAFDRPANDRLPWLIPPTFWGASGATPTTPGGMRWSVPPGNEMRPVGNISWRMAAMYCNWLHNDKHLDRAAFLNGAYDVNTFDFVGNVFTDQATHNPDARYWIPTWDEWLKAAHFDPNRNGTGQGGWWIYPNGSDQPLLPGPPPSMGGTGQANFGWSNGGLQWTVPLGAYAGVTSPWGLYDVAGGTREWLEEILTVSGANRYRVLEGSAWGTLPASGVIDSIYSRGGEVPTVDAYDFGFRIASNVPAPVSSAVGVGFLLFSARPRRGRFRCY